MLLQHLPHHPVRCRQLWNQLQQTRHVDVLWHRGIQAEQAPKKKKPVSWNKHGLTLNKCGLRLVVQLNAEQVQALRRSAEQALEALEALSKRQRLKPKPIFFNSRLWKIECTARPALVKTSTFRETVASRFCQATVSNEELRKLKSQPMETKEKETADKDKKAVKKRKHAEEKGSKKDGKKKDEQLKGPKEPKAAKK